VLDNLINGDGDRVPDPVFEAASMIAQYNALLQIRAGFAQSGLEVPAGLAEQLTKLMSELAECLEQASEAIDNIRYNTNTWSQQQPQPQEPVVLPWWRRWWIVVTNPDALAPAPPQGSPR